MPAVSVPWMKETAAVLELVRDKIRTFPRSHSPMDVNSVPCSGMQCLSSVHMRTALASQSVGAYARKKRTGMSCVQSVQKQIQCYSQTRDAQ